MARSHRIRPASRRADREAGAILAWAERIVWPCGLGTGRPPQRRAGTHTIWTSSKAYSSCELASVRSGIDGVELRGQGLPPSGSGSPAGPHCLAVFQPPRAPEFRRRISSFSCIWRPCSALGALVSTRNSSMESTDGRTASRLKKTMLLLMPSTTRLLTPENSEEANWAGSGAARMNICQLTVFATGM